MHVLEKSATKIQSNNLCN